MPRVDPWFEALARVTSVGVLMFDTNGEIQFASGLARQMLRYGEGDELRDHIGPLAESVTKVNHQCQDESFDIVADPHRQLFVIDRPDGKHHLAAAAHAIRTEECVGVLVLLWDQDQQRMLENDLRLASRFRNIGQLYQAMAHDLRTPVSTIVMATGVLRTLQNSSRDGEADPAMNVEKWLDAIDEGVTTLDQSINLLLGELITHDDHQDDVDLGGLVEAVQKLVSPLARQRQIGLEISVSERRAIITGSPTRLKLALLNIANNAIQAMPNGGELRLELGCVGDSAEVTISDTGVGMAPDVKQRIFDKYFSTKSGGTGIGLHIAKEIVDHHRGTISVESEPGRGSVFRMRFPIK